MGPRTEYLGTAATWPPVLMDPGSGAVLSAFPPRRDDDIWLAGIRYGRFRASGLAAPQVAFAMRCGDPPGCSLYEYNALGARDIVVTITDDAAPAIVAGEALPSGWRRDGSIPLSFTGSDAVGVYELELKLDGDVLASAVRGGCYEPAVNTLARPCVGSPRSPRPSTSRRSPTAHTSSGCARSTRPATPASGSCPCSSTTRRRLPRRV